MPRPTLASLLEDFRNWNKTQDWMLNKQRDIYGNEDPDTIAMNEKLAGIGTADMGVMGSSVGGLAAMLKSLPYQIEHKPMTIEGGAAPLHDLVKAFQEDIYGNPRQVEQIYGSGLAGEREMINLLQKLRGKPEELVDIYRGVPEGVTDINPGDWVTLHPRYAEEYGNVISKKVPAKYITSWPDSLVEFGYYPK